MKIRFEEIIIKMEREVSILNQLKTFRNTSDESVLRKFEIYTTLFDKNISNIRETIEQF